MRQLLVLVFFGLAAPSLIVAVPPLYTIGGVPSQPVFRGTPSAFQLQSAKSGIAAFGYSVDPGSATPQGAIALDSSTGLFSYTAAPTDKLDFSLTFTSTISGSAPDSQSVHFTLPPETDLVQAPVALPDPAGTDYLLVTQSQNAAQEPFNTISRPTWNVEISGKTVIFDSSTPNYGGLYTRFHNRPDMKNMSIYAETLIVRSPLKLPGANVTVYARELRFEDTAGTASVDTTPNEFPPPTSQSQNGAVGQKGGDITLHIQRFYSPSGPTIRFIANGGSGQAAGQGKNGDGKFDYVPPNKGGFFTITQNGSHAQINWPYGRNANGLALAANGSSLLPPYPSVVSVTSDRCGELVMGQPPRWPADGDDAISPGKPGPGGAGGTIASSLPITPGALTFLGGTSGTPGDPRLGGPPQGPVFSGWFKTVNGTNCLNDHFDAQVTALHTSVKGRDASSVPASQPKGPDGSFLLINDPGAVSWIHPYLLRAVIAHAKDTYRVGNLAVAQSILQDYDNMLSNHGILPPTVDLILQQIQIDIEGVLYRISNNMDYFGNTAGWVPLLSLDATMRAFQGEVNAAVPVLFLSRWLQAKADLNQKDVAALKDAIAKSKTESDGAASDMNLALQAVPNLQSDTAQLSAEVQNLQNDLQVREDQLVAQAQKNLEDQKNVPVWKQSLRVIGTVAEMVPVYQPVLGAVGKGLVAVTNIDVNASLAQNLQNIPDMSALFSKEDWAKSEANYKEFVGALPYTLDSLSDASDTLDVLSQMKDNYKANMKDVTQAIQSLSATQISDKDVKAEFDKISGHDSLFHDLIARTAVTQTEKQALVQKLANTMQAIASDTATITKDLASIASMYQKLNSTAGQFDHAVVGYVKDMETRARERLLRYQYYMAKAYEVSNAQALPRGSKCG